MTPLDQAFIQFVVLGIAQPKGSARAFMPKGARFPVITSDNKSLKAWERSVRDRLQQIMPAVPRPTRVAIWDAPIAIELRFELPRPKSLPKRVLHHLKKPDLDKLTRGAIDPLIGIVFRDDSQVVKVIAEKHYTDVAARLEILVAAYDGPLFQPGEDS
jgi:Holliday junction resolvase RusA-like endonuclease